MGRGYDKMIIKEDFLGLWVNAGGYVARPINPTQFKVGQDVKTYHFGGSTKAGVGKDITCNRGHYLEYWTTTGIIEYELNRLYKKFPKSKIEKHLKHDWDFYRSGKFDLNMWEEFSRMKKEIY